MSYLSELLHDPLVASVAPSSRYLARRVVAAADPEAARLVVELGPAEGVITRHLLRSMPERSRLLAVELHPSFMRGLRDIHDLRLAAVEGDARDLAAHMRRLRLGRADAVVSGVPLSLLDEDGRRRLLSAVRGALKPGGRFVAYQLTPQLTPLLKEGFRDLEVGFELRNLPPLFVLSCRK